jgi:hypothetical protein
VVTPYKAAKSESSAVGDFNRDGIPDLVVANAYQGGSVGTVSILLGNGDGTFRASTEFDAGGAETTAVAVGDFNGDGKPDLVVANDGDLAGPSNVAVLLGNGDGTFMPAVVFPTNRGTDSVAVADFNDGDRSRNDSRRIVHGRRKRAVTFSQIHARHAIKARLPTTNAGPGDEVQLAVAADLNGDGRLDLAVANENSDSITVLLGRGDGTFQAAVNYPAGPGPSGIASGDFNGDGKLDLVVANVGSSLQRGSWAHNRHCERRSPKAS